jgi:hypothetical protein
MNKERELIRSSLTGWDTAVIGSVRLPCVFDHLYEDSLGVEGAAPTALVATADILGSEARAPVTVGTTTLTIETIDGRTEGPFMVEVLEPGDPGTTLMRMSEQ